MQGLRGEYSTADVGEFTSPNELIGFYDEGYGTKAPKLARGDAAVTVGFEAEVGSRVPVILAVRTAPD